MFLALCAHHQEVKLYYTAYGIATICRWPSGAQVGRGLKFRKWRLLYNRLHCTIFCRHDNWTHGIFF